MNFERKQEESEFEERKTKYFSDFAVKHMAEMRILAEGGILGSENKDWRNISEHCLSEAVVADILAEHLKADRKGVAQATLLHDWYKRKEVEAMQEHGADAGYQKTTEEDEKELRKLGVPEHIVRLAHANIPESDEKEHVKSRSLEEKIVHFADHIIQGSEIVNFTERRRVLEQKKRNVEFSDSFKRQYSGKSLFDVQFEDICPSEQGEFEESIGLEKGSLIDFLRNELRKRIDSV